MDPLGLSTRYEREWAQMEGQMSAEAEWNKVNSRSNGSNVGRMDNMVHGLGAEWRNASQFREMNLHWARFDPARVSDQAWDFLERSGDVNYDSKRHMKYGTPRWERITKTSVRPLTADERGELEQVGWKPDPTNRNVLKNGTAVMPAFTEVHETGWDWTGNDLSVTLVFRPIGDSFQLPNLPGLAGFLTGPLVLPFRHGALFVHRGNTVVAQYSLQKGSPRFEPQDSASYTFLADRDAFLNGGIGVTTHTIDPPGEMDADVFAGTVMLNADFYKADPSTYWLWPGPNSNTAAVAPLRAIPGTNIPSVWSAPGMGY